MHNINILLYQVEITNHYNDTYQFNKNNNIISIIILIAKLI